MMGKLPAPGRPTIWITVGQRPTAAVGVGGVVWTFLISSTVSFPLSPSLWETALYRLKYFLNGALSPKPTNQLLEYQLWSLFCAYLLMMLYICTKFHKKYLKGFLRVIQRTRFLIFEFSKGNNSVKNIGWSYGTFSLLLSDDALYLCKVS